MDRRIYLDNAATSFPKPPAVLEAMSRYATELGASAGRGGYREALETGDLISECRHRLNTLFNGENPNHFIFTLNCSDALNLAIKGLIEPDRKSHVICTWMDHNSILRPLSEMAERGWITQTRVPADPQTGLIDPQQIARAIRPETRLIALTHASNVTGSVQPIREIGKIARERGITFIVDAAQSAGHLPIDVRADNIDLLAAPGHKGLLGPLGTGFLYVRPGIEKILRSVREGGTGSQSELDRQPDFLPDKYEPGSHNAIGIIGLSAGVQWILNRGVSAIAKHAGELSGAFIEGIRKIEGASYFGPRGAKDRVGVFAIRLAGLDPHELAAVLETNFGMLTRAGIHCAPLAHETIGTASSGGTTRLSFGPFLNLQDISEIVDALEEICQKLRDQQSTSYAMG